MKSLRTYIISVSCLLVIYLVAQYNRPDTINWTESFSSNQKIPFGTYVLYNRLHDIFPKAQIETYHEPVYNVVNDHGIKHATYIIICSALNLNEYDYKKLQTFIKNGNDVFISAAYFGDQVQKNLKVSTQSLFRGIKSSPRLKFVNKTLDTDKLYSVDKGIGGIYFDSIDTAKATVLGTDGSGDVNFIKYSLGKGTLYLNANPLMFTNYSIFNRKSTGYASTALSFVKNDDNVIWDQYYAVGREDDESSMRVFLRNPSMRWAFYIAFFSLVIFVLYEIKRRQRIIPLIEPLENETLSFVNVVGQVYYEQRDNTNISNKKVLYFLEHVRTAYNLKTHPLDDAFADSLAQKTGIEHAFAIKLVNYLNYIGNKTNITVSELKGLNKHIEEFYKQSR